MQRSFGRHRIFIALSALGLALSVPGCVSARDTHEVARSHAEAIGRLAIESAIANAALIHAIGALSSIRIELVVSDTEASIITDLIRPDGAADLATLDAIIEQSEIPLNPLATQVRESRMSVDVARSWLFTYAAALADPNDAVTRRRLLEVLRPVVTARSEAAALGAALRDRAASNDRLFADARASAHALLGASTSDPSIDALVQSAADSWMELLLESIDDPEQRAAAQRLLGSILDWSDMTGMSGMTDMTDMTDMAPTTTGDAQ